jgi:hypothetical protein
MAQQKSEDRVVPDGGVMPAQPADGGQGKAVPVDQEAWQLRLPIATAEDPAGSARKAARDRSRAGRAGVPTAVVTEEKSAPARMEEVAARLDLAMKKVVANRGAPGPDGMTVEMLRERWSSIAVRLRGRLLSGRKNVEDAFGHVRYLALYIAGGLVAAMTQAAATLIAGTAGDATVPILGASGAIAAVLGAYWVLYPNARILTLVFVFPVRIRASIFLGLWFV